MRQQKHRPSERHDRHDRSPETRDNRDAPRIPCLLPSHTVFANERAANCLLGLLASHADKQMPLLDQRELMRRRQQIEGKSRPVLLLEATSSATHPVTLQQSVRHEEKEPRIIINGSNSGFIEDKVSLASSLVAFPGRSNKRGSPRLQDNMMSPRSMRQKNSLKERPDPTASPRQIAASTSRLHQTQPTTSSWRIHNLLSPDSTGIIQSHTSHKRRTPPTSFPQEKTESIASSLKRPRLAHRVASRWRQELFPRDRAQTRERILRSLHNHCQGDYEKLVLILSSMEEELLHIKTTSRDFYSQQAFELSNLIEHATLER